MELKSVDSTTRWVSPFGEDREEAVEMRRISDFEFAAINDKAGLRPGSDKNTYKKQTEALKTMCRASIVNWRGFTSNGKPVECSDANKNDFLDVMVTVDGEERKSLWALCWEKFQEQESAELKN